MWKQLPSGFHTPKWTPSLPERPWKERKGEEREEEGKAEENEREGEE